MEIPEHIKYHMEKNADKEKPEDRHHERRGKLLNCDNGAPLAENFQDEFKDQRIPEITHALGEMGFPLASTQTEDEKIVFKGIREDGTTMEIIVTKGKGYVSPADYTEEDN